MAHFAYGRGYRKITHSSAEKATITPSFAGLSCLWRNTCKESFVEIESESFQEKSDATYPSIFLLFPAKERQQAANFQHVFESAVNKQIAKPDAIPNQTCLFIKGK